MSDWMLPHIISYWDERMEAIERFSRVIAATAEAERAAELLSLSAAVARHASALTDADIVKFAVPIVEDLYKAVAKRSQFDQPLFQYLQASCGPFFQALTERGYMVHYFINNTWSRLDGPAIGFPMWFSAVRLPYICPQDIACRDYEKDKPPEEWPALVTKYIEDGRIIAKELANRCHATGRHFVYLDIDAPDFDIAFKMSGEPGVIWIYREEAPTPGSRCAMRLPTEPRKPETPAEDKPSAPASTPALSPAPTPGAPPSQAGGGTAKLKPLIDGLVGGNEQTRRTNRQALRAALFEALTEGTDLDALKADFLAFRNAGWTLIGESEYGEGEYTLAAAINTLINAIRRRSELKAWLPLVVDDRIKRFMGAPVADLDPAAWSELDNALTAAAEFNASA